MLSSLLIVSSLLSVGCNNNGKSVKEEVEIPTQTEEKQEEVVVEESNYINIEDYLNKEQKYALIEYKEEYENEAIRMAVVSLASVFEMEDSPKVEEISRRAHTHEETKGLKIDDISIGDVLILDNYNFEEESIPVFAVQMSYRTDYNYPVIFVLLEEYEGKLYFVDTEVYSKQINARRR